MATYYVSANRGSDLTGVGSATNPWKTIGKAIGSSPAITLSGSGDTLYIEPGIYREVVSLGLSPTAAGPLSIVGDCDGAGFLAGGYASPATGLVDWRGWTNDSTPLGSSACLNVVGKSYVTVKSLKIVGASNTSKSCVYLNGAALNWTFQDCVFVSCVNGAAVVIEITAAAGQAWNHTIERCDFVATGGGGYGLRLLAQQNPTEYGVNTLVQNCRFLGGSIGLNIAVTGGGSGSALATGITVQSCTGLFCTTFADIYGATAVNPTTPIGVYGCYVGLCSTGVKANNTTQVVENGNILYVTTPRSNVNAGAASITSAAPAIHCDDGRLTGLPSRPFGEPSEVGVIGGWGNYGNVPTVDLSNRNRPEGYSSPKAAAGALERHNTGAKDVTRQDVGLLACLALVGPSSQDRPILVNAQSTTLSIRVRWDGNHGDAAKPQAILLANPEIGVASQTLTAVSTGGTGATPNAYETLTFAPITPTAAGVVMLRMTSRAAAGNGAAYFDTITLT
jgi:hypothetical protein